MLYWKNQSFCSQQRIDNVVYVYIMIKDSLYIERMLFQASFFNYTKHKETPITLIQAPTTSL